MSHTLEFQAMSTKNKERRISMSYTFPRTLHLWLEKEGRLSKTNRSRVAQVLIEFARSFGKNFS